MKAEVSRPYGVPRANIYVGQTERPLKQRYFEHIRYIKCITRNLHMFYIRIIQNVQAYRLLQDTTTLTCQ